MQSIVANKNDAGQRLDKFLAKYLKDAPKSFLYKMLRKKNITLNGKKAVGNEILQLNDEIKFFLSDETIAKFKGQTLKKYPTIPLNIIYEDDDLIFINKPAGMLSQKADDGVPSMVEYLIGYLLKENKLSEQDLERFKPSVCNRLDRNTSGLIAAGKSLMGLQFLSEQFKSRDMNKYYYALVKGVIKRPEYLKGYLKKDAKTNKVVVHKEQDVTFGSNTANDESYIETKFEPVAGNDSITLLKVHLITGKTHQIRAHLSSIGHPIAGDHKYGDHILNHYMEKMYGVKHQLLHASTLLFEKDALPESFLYLEGKEVKAPLPDYYEKVLKCENLKKYIGEKRI